jgi:hypothetical protein
MLTKVSGGRISDRCGNFVEGVRDAGHPVRDAAPTEAGAVPSTSLPSDHACIFSTCWPRQTWIATSRRGWVIAAWVLECRARSADSSVRTACDSYC